MEEVICTHCRRETGFKTDYRILYDPNYAPADKSPNGYFLLHGFACPRCLQNNVWSFRTAQEIKELRRQNARN